MTLIPPVWLALLPAISAFQDSFDTACNVTGDGAMALMPEGLFNRSEGKVSQA
jgi:Na+/H+-dicarboxylate symporter